MRLNDHRVIRVPALCLTIAAVFVLGAYLALRRTATKEACAARLPQSERAPRRPGVDGQKTAHAERTRIDELQSKGLPDSLARLSLQYSAELGDWATVAPEEAVKRPYWKRRPRVERNEHGNVVALEFDSLEQLGDNALDDVFDSNATPPGTRRALDRIDSLLELLVREHDETALVAYVERDHEATSDFATRNFLQAARVRAVLALGELSLSPKALASVEALMRSDADPMLRGAAAALLASRQRDETVREWLAQERESRAIEAMLCRAGEPDTPAFKMFAPQRGEQPSHPNPLAPHLSGFLVDPSNHPGLRIAAAQAIGRNIAQPWALPTLERALAMESVPDVRAAIIGATSAAAGNPRVEALLVRLARSQDAAHSDRAAAVMALGKLGSEQACDAVIDLLGTQSVELRRHAAFTLVAVRGVTAAQRAAIEAAYAGERDDEVRKCLKYILDPRSRSK